METSQRFTSLGYFQIGSTGSGALSLLNVQSLSGASGVSGTGVVTGSGLIGLGANMALLSISNQNIRFRDDGVAPTAGTGVLLTANSTFEYSGNLAGLQFAGFAGAVVDVLIYKASGVWIAAALAEPIFRLLVDRWSG